jgi:hypothetical protein
MPCIPIACDVFYISHPHHPSIVFREMMPTKFLNRLLPIVFLATMFSNIAVAAPGIDFKGIPLGILLEDFRILQHPDGLKNTEVICSNDEDMNSY